MSHNGQDKAASVGSRLRVRIKLVWLVAAVTFVCIATSAGVFADQGHWAYRPIHKPAVPETSSSLSRDTDIDRFVVAKLERQGLALSSPLEKASLIRRATFDLLGLPPSWEEVQSFVADPAEGAFAKVVDRLLDSPHYGERWGRHWLDIARYADTFGGGAIGFRRFAFSYTYRDYVIQAFNDDLPYDRFVLEQLAADQLDLNSNDPALAALGFLTVGRQYRNRHDLIDDHIDVVTRGLLGLTVTCARCHDHKYDTISTEDYYSLYATFAVSKPPFDLPLLGQPRDSEEYRQYQAELDRRQHRYRATQREQSEVLRHRLRMQVGEYLQEIAKQTPEQDLSTIFLSYRTDDIRPLMIHRWREYLDMLSDEDPVFGPWRQLSKVDATGVAARAVELIEAMKEENGDVSGLALHSLNTQSPRWNPRVLDAVAAKSPQSLLQVAEAYGELFGQVQQEWLGGLMASSLEARADTAVVPDEDPRQTDINSSVNRQLRDHLYGSESPVVLTELDAATMLNRTIRDHVNGLKGAIHDHHLASAGSPPRAMVLEEEEQPGPFHVFVRGNPLERGKPVAPRFLDALSTELSEPFRDGQRRLALARAVIAPANPLTRRVIVNWVWQRHFGVGLVRTPDDFGTRGEPPTHPGLLDYLAELFLEDGWSIKTLHRRIMLTGVYQQAAVENSEARNRDPGNLLLWRMPRRRLDVEAMRDSMLAVAGRLDVTAGGRPFDLFSEPFTPRRSVYGFVNRDVLANFFSTFDMADPSVCAATRPDTMVPQQTLFALNSHFIQEQANHLAQHKELDKAETDQQRIRMMYQRAFSRSPSEEELGLAQRYLESQASSRTNPWRQLAQILLAANEFVFID